MTSSGSAAGVVHIDGKGDPHLAMAWSKLLAFHDRAKTTVQAVLSHDDVTTWVAGFVPVLLEAAKAEGLAFDKETPQLSLLPDGDTVDAIYSWKLFDPVSGIEMVLDAELRGDVRQDLFGQFTLHLTLGVVRDRPAPEDNYIDSLVHVEMVMSYAVPDFKTDTNDDWVDVLLVQLEQHALSSDDAERERLSQRLVRDFCEEAQRALCP